MIPQFKWKPHTTASRIGEALYVGNWKVGFVTQENDGRGFDPNKWVPICKLPGVREIHDHHPTIDEAKQRLEKIVSYWFEKLK